jgi:hypothetical protein
VKVTLIVVSSATISTLLFHSDAKPAFEADMLTVSGATIPGMVKLPSSSAFTPRGVPSTSTQISS